MGKAQNIYMWDLSSFSPKHLISRGETTVATELRGKKIKASQTLAQS